MNAHTHRFLTTLPLFFVALAAAQNGPPPTPPAPVNVSSTSILAGPSEPGERLIVTGQVFAPDGITPAAGVILYAYQTDSSGLYHNDSNHIARLHGWVKTDASGQFEFRTIRPGPYPRLSIAAHIHFHAWGRGYPLQWAEELEFAGDPLLSSQQIAASQARGDFANIRAVNRGADGMWHCTIRLRLSRQTNYPAQYRDDPRTH